jgi:Fic/DOC family
MGIAWDDVDPANHVFEPDAIRRAIDRALRNRTSRHIQKALIAEFGVWIFGWSWGVSDGGLVKNWCCDSHSFKGDPAETIYRAVCEWQAILVELAAWFPKLGIGLRGGDEHQLDQREILERAAAEILVWVVERTEHSDAWYSTFHMIIEWFVASKLDCENVEFLIEKAIGGRFHSWSEPDSKTAADVCADLSLAIAEASVKSPAVPDALAVWQTFRAEPGWSNPGWSDGSRSAVDGHGIYIEKVDRAQEPERANRMASALSVCRRNAEGHQVLSFAVMQDSQRHVLNASEVGFRKGDAFAKEGRQRYAWKADTQSRFKECLIEANNASVDPLARAARVYLDVCFFHPFADGNARAARLALDFVLTKANLTLLDARPIFTLARSPLDPKAIWALWQVLNQLTATRMTNGKSTKSKA